MRDYSRIELSTMSNATLKKIRKILLSELESLRVKGKIPEEHTTHRYELEFQLGYIEQILTERRDNNGGLTPFLFGILLDLNHFVLFYGRFLVVASL